MSSISEKWDIKKDEEFDFSVCDWCGEKATSAVRITLENGWE